MGAYYSRARSYSRSYNAHEAEADGRLPLTRAVACVCQEAICPPSVARRVLLAIGSDEWHHVGKFATRVDYYDAVRAARIARRVTKPAERARVLRAWTRAAWIEAAERRVRWLESEALRARNARLAAELAERARLDELERPYIEAAAEIERQRALAGLIANYRRNPTAGRAEALRRQFKIDPETLKQEFAA